MTEFRLKTLKNLRRRDNEVWQGGIVRLPMWIGPPGTVPWRASAPLWVSMRTGLVQPGDPFERDTRDPGAVLDAFMKFATDGKLAGYLPGRVEVTDDEIAALLREALADLGIVVVARERLGGLEMVRKEMSRALQGENPIQPALEAPGMTAERLASFAEAARLFYAAAPWVHLTNEDLIRVEEPAGPAELSHFLVLGAGGKEFGLLLFESPEMYELLLGGEDERQSLIKRRHHSVYFGGPDELPMEDADLFEDMPLPVASPAAYPWAVIQGPGRRTRRPDGKTTARLEALLRALAATTEAEIDSGRWSRIVPSSDGAVKITLALPDLIREEPRAMRRPGIPDRRVMERITAEIHRHFEQNPADSLDDANRVIAERFMGRTIDDIPSTAKTPLEKAQDLCYAAFELHGRRRVRMAREALALSPDCADAFIILAEQCGDRAETLRLYTQAVAAGERALGPGRFDTASGPFWSDIGTRPYMRALQGVAETSGLLGDKAAAIRGYARLLQLNPGDNQGVRYPLVGLLLESGDTDAAGTLLEQQKDDDSATMLFARALWLFMIRGDKVTSRRALEKAIRENPHVIPILLDREGEPPAEPDQYAFGSEEEAAIVFHCLAAAWTSAPGALAWIGSISSPSDEDD